MANLKDDKFLQEICRQIHSCEMLAANDRWLLAVSGGTDSMAMLHGLLMLAESGLVELSALHVAHLNHLLRGSESEADAEFVRRQTLQLGLEITVGSIEIAKIASQTGCSIETAARKERYHFLSETAVKYGCNKIALAHNADDNAETILHRFIRGTGIRGLAGIPAVRSLSENEREHYPSQSSSATPPQLQLIRPLLRIPRSEIESFLQRYNIEFRVDSSNMSVEHTRNRIRHELLPLLRDNYNPNVNKAIEQLGEIAGQLDEILRPIGTDDLNILTLKQEKNCLTLDAAGLSERPKIRQSQIIYQALLALHVPQRLIGFKQIGAVIDLAGDRNDTKKSIQLPYKLRAELIGEKLVITKDIDNQSLSSPPTFGQTPLRIPGTTTLQPGCAWIDPVGQTAQVVQGLRAEIIISEGRETGGPLEILDEFRQDKSPCQEMFDLDNIEGPLVLRTRRDGDVFWPLGAPGAKKLGDFLTDAKIPTAIRDQIGILCDKTGIVWVMGLRIAERVKVTAQTRKLLKFKISKSVNQ